MEYNCNKCKSENISKLSVIYESGRSNFKESGTSKGMIFSSSYNSNGSSKSNLSESVSPPGRVSYLLVSIIWLITFFVIANLGLQMFDVKGKLFEYIAYTFLFILLALVRNYNKKIYKPKLTKWNKSYMCFRCGNIFVLENKSTVSK